MSEEFRCDGCDEYYGGSPTEVSIGTKAGTVGLTEIVIGHAAGRDDACPADDEPVTRFGGRLSVDQPSISVQRALQNAAKRGRFEPEKEGSDD